MEKEPLLSVVVITHRGDKTIAKALESIFNAKYRNKEVIVVANDPDDPSLEVAKEFPVRMYCSEQDGEGILGERGRGRGYQRELGWRVAKGEFIANCDDDKTIEKEWFTKILNCFNDSKVGGVTGVELNMNGDNLINRMRDGYGWALYYSYRLLSKFSHIRMIKGANTVWRKEALEDVDGYAREFSLTAEDSDLSFRAIRRGWVLLMADAISYHYEDLGFKEILTKRRKLAPYEAKSYAQNKMRPSPLLNLYILFTGILFTPGILWRTKSLRALAWPLFFVSTKLAMLPAYLRK